MSSRFTHRARAVTAALLAAATAACAADGPAAPAAPAAPAQPAAAHARHDVRLTTPHDGDAGALLVVSGAEVDSVTTAAGVAVLVPGEGATRVILSGALSSGVVATVWTRPGSGAPSIALEQVTAAGTHAQRDLAGYRVQIER
jgi:hypothetical protein